MIEIVYLRDAAMPREAFEQLPTIPTDGGSVAHAVKRMRGQLCRAMIERDGGHAWHALAWININGTERVTAARVRFGHYHKED